MSKMALHESFGHLQPKLWAKEGPGIKLAVWLPTTKSRESTQSWRAMGECDMALESPWGELQGWGEELWWPKVLEVQTGTISGLHVGSPGTKSHSGVGAVEQRREYYMGEGGGFPWVRAVMSQVSPRSPVACPNTKKGVEWVLTNLWLVLDAGPNK
jgi:hypothetical protein